MRSNSGSTQSDEEKTLYDYIQKNDTNNARKLIISGEIDIDELIDDSGEVMRLKSASHYVIGGKDYDVNIWDGVILRSFDDQFWAYHLGIDAKNSEQVS